MGIKSTIEKQVPADVKTKLITMIIEGKQSQLSLMDWINDQGYDISKSAINRYCIKIKHELTGLECVGITSSDFSEHKQEYEELGRLLTLKFFADEKIGDVIHKIKGES